jgi:hypothetical protein
MLKLQLIEINNKNIRLWNMYQFEKTLYFIICGHKVRR